MRSFGSAPDFSAETKSLILQRIARGTSLAVMGIAVVVLLGWIIGSQVLIAVQPGWTTMKVNTALCFLCSGLALLGLSPPREAMRPLKRAAILGAAGLVIAIGLATLLEYLVPLGLGIDQLFFADPTHPVKNYHAGRMSPFSAFNFCCVGFALIFLAAKRSAVWVQVIAGCAAFITMVVLTGTAYGLESLLAEGHSSAVALHTNLSFCLLYVGIFCACGPDGVMRLVTDSGAAGAIVRRLLPTAVLLPMAVSWICAMFERLGLFGVEMGISIFSISTIVLFTALVWRSAEVLQHSEKEARAAKSKMSESLQRFTFLAESMPQIVWIARADGNIEYFNRRWYEHTGLSASESMNWGWQPVIHPDDLSLCLERWRTALATGCDYEVEYRFKRASDGAYRWQLGRATPLRDDRGEIIQWFGTSTDIDEQKRARTELEQRVAERTAEVAGTQKRLQALLDAAMHVSIIATDPEGLITVFNRGAEQMLGYSAEEMVGTKTPAGFHLGSEVEARSRELTAALGRPIKGFDVFVEQARGGKAEEREWTYVRKNGTTLTANLVVTPLSEAEGKITGFLGIAMDVTARKKAEKQLQDQALILDLARETIFVWDFGGFVTYWNQGAERLYGWKSKEMIGKVTHESLKTIFPVPLAEIEERLDTTGHWEGELIHTLRDGSLVTVASSWTLQRDKAGRPLSVIEINHDITARKKAEQELEKSRQRLNAILFGSIDGVIVYEAIRGDAGKIEDFRFTMINPAAEKMMRTTATELLGQRMLEKYPHARDDGLFKKFTQIVESGFTIDFEYESSRTATPRWYRIAGVKLDDGLVISYTEITTRKENERRLKEAKEHAELADRAKSDFLANMSHEIRTPMNGVIGMTGLLLDSRLDAEQRSLGETIRASAESLLGLINDILDFSKIEAGKLTFEEIDFDLRKVVEDTLEMMAGQALAKKIELVGGIEPGMATKLRGDPGRVHQLLTNLVSNAIKFTSKGEVAVRVKAETQSETEVLVRFEIEDTGIGIAPEAQEQLFQPFVQGDSSTSRKFGGTGLGLAICKRLAESMRGEIGVTSRPGQGSTFWVTLKFPVQAGAANDAPPVLDFADVRVLVVENNETSRHYLHRQIVAWRLRDGCATTAAEALAMLRKAATEKEPYALAIIDAQLPGVDGFALIREINADAALGATRIILLLPFGKPIASGDLSNVLIAGSCAKPVRQSMLFDCMAHALGREGNVGVVRQKDSHRPVALEPPARKERILLAEDNVVNQQVALGNLRKLGFAADVAANGLEVLEAIGMRRYDVILMDCQMPELDGYEVTREIRRREKTGHRTWIIAMTANAMVGDREKCLAAGMDDYVAKPLRRPELRAALDRVVGRPAQSILDERVLQNLQADDAAGLVMLIDLFNDTAPSRLVEMAKALEIKSAAQLAMAAHSLKGSCSNLGATLLREACGALETSAGAGEMEGAADRVAMIERELRRAIDGLISYKMTNLTA